jgi:glycosyltransferase involved in cell wall biosynthesis
MFQYAQAVLDALACLPGDRYRVLAAHADPRWGDYLARYRFERIAIAAGQRMAEVMMTLRIPGTLNRAAARWINPASRALLSGRCDLWLFPAQDILSYQTPVPALVSVHDLMHRYERRFPEVSNHGRYAAREQRFGGIARYAAGIVVDSEIGRRQVLESYGADPGRVHCLPYIAPSYIYAPTPAGFDKRYTLPEKFAFYPAQFWEHKNHRRLVDAAASLRAEFPDIHLVFSGSLTHGYRALADHVRNAGMVSQVTFAGRVADADMPEFYCRARCMVMPTFFGPTNIPPLEAFALGCPAAVSGIYGMPEQAGGAALLFNPESQEDMARCLGRLWRDDALCADLRRKGLARAAAWNAEGFNARLRAIIDTVVGEPGSAAR